MSNPRLPDGQEWLNQKITKKQDTRNKQISNSNIQVIKLFGKLNIGHCILFVSCPARPYGGCPCVLPARRHGGYLLSDLDFGLWI
jgi:hypothetical protein